jgi:hypothetical protein
MSRRKSNKIMREQHIAHCIDRAAERFQLTLTKEDVRHISRQIGKARMGREVTTPIKKIKARSLRTIEYQITFSGATFFCYYSLNDRLIRTIFHQRPPLDKVVDTPTGIS